EIVLGIGGLRLLDALGVEADVYHMNEGHCSFLGLELLRKRLASVQNGTDAADWVRSRCVFTTHTPVWAGHDRFDAGLLLHSLRAFQQEIGMSDHELMSWGRVNPDDHTEQFTMTVLGLKLSRSANGVSRLNGEVARRQWAHMFPEREVDDVPIRHVTNGIHVPTWAAAEARPFLNEHFGAWETGRDRQETWNRVDDVSDEALWAYRRRLRERLIEFVEDAVSRQTLPQTVDLDPDALTIGFARRFATYKRAPLIFSDPERAARIFSSTDRPVQLIYAGKAHPADELGKEFIRKIVEFSRRPDFRGRVIFLEDYSIEIGRKLVSGCDVWLNNPRRPHEASGTSGQKVAVHGGLNLSIPDGWWPEGYDGTNGWSIGKDSSHVYKDPAVQDPEDALLLYDLLEKDVIPAFYDRNDAGLPEGWIERMRRAMKTLVYPFSAHRMVLDYASEIYAAPTTEPADVTDVTSA
ncbi:MAG: alpha-glucan family phosphorylase, partial [Rhodothermales bacterium]|nr:alpha-glucan family phosphorylase [Rhodothermales bacterium]